MGRLKINNLSIAFQNQTLFRGSLLRNHVNARVPISHSHTPRPHLDVIILGMELHTVSLLIVIVYPPIGGPLPYIISALENKKKEKVFHQLLPRETFLAISLNDTLYCSSPLHVGPVAPHAAATSARRKIEIDFFTTSTPRDFQVSDSCNKTLIS